MFCGSNQAPDFFASSFSILQSRFLVSALLQPHPFKIERGPPGMTGGILFIVGKGRRCRYGQITALFVEE